MGTQKRERSEVQSKCKVPALPVKCKVDEVLPGGRGGAGAAARGPRGPGRAGREGPFGGPREGRPRAGRVRV